MTSEELAIVELVGEHRYRQGQSCDSFEVVLDNEQQDFVEKALQGHNILVDATVGSGKTTSIQRLCDLLPADKSILYLTYSKLLKFDAQSKILNQNVKVTNYHGFACPYVSNVGVSDFIRTFLKNKPAIKHFDILILDEYQDVDQEIAEMLEYIKSTNPNMQIIAVGDMAQKIYDKTSLKVQEWIGGFLGSYLNINFINCYRLNSDHASMLSRIWGKPIVGVNEKQIVQRIGMDDAYDIVSKSNPSDVLCLGSTYGDMTKLLNKLEKDNPHKWNKHSTYASIRERDANLNLKGEFAIFTTYDSAKGMERQLCLIFDFTEDYWQSRIEKPQQSYEILRNIFAVAASRGKGKIVFVKGRTALLSEETLSDKSQIGGKMDDVNISEMFDFKHKESVDSCYDILKIKQIKTNLSEIKAETLDGLIDLSPGIGIWQEISFFENTSIDVMIERFIESHSRSQKEKEYNIKRFNRGWSDEFKCLFLVNLMTKQDRYTTQVKLPFINDGAKKAIHDRLAEIFTGKEETQRGCQIDFDEFEAKGFADVIVDNIVYELKFVNSLNHEHFLQCASYIVALGLKKKGVLWNVRTNELFEITVPSKKKFLDFVKKTVIKC